MLPKPSNKNLKTMRSIIYANANSAFEGMFKEILDRGLVTGCGTKALYDVSILIKHPQENIISCEWRKWKEDYAKREWEWYLSGDRSVKEIKKHAKLWDKMHNGDNLVNSNYGYQWKRNEQLSKCIEQLKANPASRQAWLTIFDGKEKDQYAYDTPCTLNVGFDIHKNQLRMTVLMRSCDLVYGFCNDQYCFSHLQQMVADALNLECGYYLHYAHDLHVYEKHFGMNPDYVPPKPRPTKKQK